MAIHVLQINTDVLSLSHMYTPPLCYDSGTQTPKPRNTREETNPEKNQNLNQKSSSIQGVVPRS